MAQGAEPAQHGGDDAAHQRAVALGELRQAGQGVPAVELLVERPAAAQHAVEDLGGDAARRQARAADGEPGGSLACAFPIGRDAAVRDIDARPRKAAAVLAEIMREIDEIDTPAAPARTRRSGGCRCRIDACQICSSLF